MEASLFRQLSGAREPVGIEGLANGKGGGGKRPTGMYPRGAPYREM